MSRKDQYPLYIIVLSLLLALVFALIQLPEPISAGRPALALLLAIYWTQFLPGGFSLIAAVILGLLLDILSGALLGQHACAFVLICFTVTKLRDSLRLFPMWQQSLALLPMVAVYEFILFWIDGITGRQADPVWRWLPVLTTALCWPLLCALLMPFRGSARQ